MGKAKGHHLQFDYTMKSSIFWRLAVNWKAPAQGLPLTGKRRLASGKFSGHDGTLYGDIAGEKIEMGVMSPPRRTL